MSFLKIFVLVNIWVSESYMFGEPVKGCVKAARSGAVLCNVLSLMSGMRFDLSHKRFARALGVMLFHTTSGSA